MAFTTDTSDTEKKIKLLLERLDLDAIDKLEQARLTLRAFKIKLFEVIAADLPKPYDKLSDLEALSHLHAFAAKVIANTISLVSSNTTDEILTKISLLHKMVHTWHGASLLEVFQATKNLEAQYISRLNAVDLMLHMKFLTKQRALVDVTEPLIDKEAIKDRQARIRLYDQLMVMVDTALEQATSTKPKLKGPR